MRWSGEGGEEDVGRRKVEGMGIRRERFVVRNMWDYERKRCKDDGRERLGNKDIVETENMEGTGI